MKIELNLLDNGLDFLMEALNHVWRKDSIENPKLWKYSVLNFFSGAELILKEKLKQEHWSLIFEDVSIANEKKLLQGDFISVNHSELIKRLKGICNVNINDDPLNELRKIRNKFEHFEVKINADECKEAIARSLQELVPFWDKYISPFCNNEQNEKFTVIKNIINDFDTYVQFTLSQNTIAINNITNSGNGILIPCFNCYNLSLILFKEEKKLCKCYVCKSEISKSKYLEKTRRDENNDEISFLVKEKYNTHCYNCERETRVRFQPSYYSHNVEDPDFYYCINCFYKETDLTIEERVSLEFNTKIEELQKTHSPEEIILILTKELEEKNS